MKTIFAVLLLAFTISSCRTYNAVVQRTSVEFTEPATLIFKLWGIGEIIETIAPANSKLSNFVEDSKKYCVIKFDKLPATINDTTVLRIKCNGDSIAREIGLQMKKEN